MKRRTFLGGLGGAAAVGSLTPLAGHAATQSKAEQPENITDRTTDNWFHLGEGEKILPSREKTDTFDVIVVGAGMAGICAAVASARSGAKTALVQDRSVLGGNASSEIRVTVNGVQHLKNKNRRTERETGIIEEILIENWYYNPQESYPVWDHVLYDFATREPNLSVMVNTQAVNVKMENSAISAVICWQNSTETMYTLYADMFIDCSGDGLMAAKAGAEYRTGREARDEFGESFAPKKADGWQMGASLMMISKDMGKPIKYRAPHFVIPFEADKMHKRDIKQIKEGYWWVELGSDDDIVADQEKNRHRLLGYMHGVWDYIKNSGKFPEAENYALDWVGSVPGRRESRRFMGDHLLTQVDLQSYRHFDDAVAYGGWSLDEHNPGGIDDPSEPPSYFHDRFEKPYEIPFRSLYSKNISNLLFAGRNVSVTHMALSSTRIQATCSLMGQAVGTASAMCIQNKISPRELANKHIKELQEQLLRDDVYIPNRPANDALDLARKKAAIIASNTISGNVEKLTDGYSRDTLEDSHHWQSKNLEDDIILEWNDAVSLSTVEVKGDTNVLRYLMMHKNPAKNKDQVLAVPPELVKAMSVEVRSKGKWKKVASTDNNITRLIKLNFKPVKTTAIRLRFQETWGAEQVKLFEVRCYS